MRRISVEQYRAMTAKPRANKHGARKVECDGHVFDSRAEMYRYVELRVKELAREIRELTLQPEVAIPTGIYRADFRYVDALGVTHWEDVKGVNTPACRLKLKMVAQLGIPVELITERSHPQYFRRAK